MSAPTRSRVTRRFLTLAGGVALAALMFGGRPERLDAGDDSKAAPPPPPVPALPAPLEFPTCGAADAGQWLELDVSTGNTTVGTADPKWYLEYRQYVSPYTVPPQSLTSPVPAFGLTAQGGWRQPPTAWSPTLGVTAPFWPGAPHLQPVGWIEPVVGQSAVTAPPGQYRYAMRFKFNPGTHKHPFLAMRISASGCLQDVRLNGNQQPSAIPAPCPAAGASIAQLVTYVGNPASNQFSPFVSGVNTIAITVQKRNPTDTAALMVEGVVRALCACK